MDRRRKKLYVRGMTCVNCQTRIQKELRQTEGILYARVSYNNGTADVEYDADRILLDEIVNVIERMNYRVLSGAERKKKDIARAFYMLAIILSLYALLQSLGILNMLVPSRVADSKMGYGMLFVIGMLTSVHCIAMCGGINMSQCLPSGNIQRERKKGKLSILLPTLKYNMGRVFSYTMTGLVLGAVGGLFGVGTKVGIPIFVQGIIKLIAGLLMVIMGINMLNLFPALRKFTIRMPKSLAGKIGKERAKSKRPFWIGVLNGFMPCGPLQSMWLVALAAGNPFAGALSMFLFSLGTVPLMMGLGSIVSALGRKFMNKAMTVGAVMVTILGLAMLSQGSSLSGLDVYNLLPKSNSEGTISDSDIELEDGKQVINSSLSSGRYPDITVQADVPVKWVIDVAQGSLNGCNYKMIIRDYGIEYTFHEGENVIEFEPDKTGTVRYSCWMGMIRGNIFVTDSDGSDIEAMEDIKEEDNQKSAQEDADDFAMPFCGCCGQ